MRVLPIPSHLTTGGAYRFCEISGTPQRIPRNLELDVQASRVLNLSFGFSTAKGGRPNETYFARREGVWDGRGRTDVKTCRERTVEQR